MSKTVAQLVTQSVRLLGIQPVSTESFAYVTSMVDPVLDDLKGRNVVDVTTSAISERHFMYVADILANRVAPEFADLVKTDKQLLTARETAAEGALMKMQRGKTAS